MKVYWFNKYDNCLTKKFVPFGVNYLKLDEDSECSKHMIEIYSSWGRWYFSTEFYWSSKNK